MGKILGITGTPGTGKKSIAPLVSLRLGIPCVAINDLVAKSLAGRVRARTIEVDTRALRRTILSRFTGRLILYGHLLPDILERRDVERVVVLRCDPKVLKRRLSERGYSKSKVAANVEAELIGIVATAARDRFGRKRVAELDTTASGKDEAARRAARLLTRSDLKAPPIDWLGAYASAVKLRSLLSERTMASPRT
jgi:adenylate kinase